jgi:hypothetical protein
VYFPSLFDFLKNTDIFPLSFMLIKYRTILPAINKTTPAAIAENSGFLDM